jgi:hypothetical protein
MPVVDAFGVRKKVEAMQGTWGHLFPDGTSYKGLVRVAFGAYGNQVILSDERPFEDSPWWMNALTEWLLEIDDQGAGEVWEYNIDIEIIPGDDDSLSHLYDAEWDITTTASRKVLESLS